jgi:hypothetical protein
MGCRLDGEWMVKFHGLESAFRPDHFAAGNDSPHPGKQGLKISGADCRNGSHSRAGIFSRLKSGI